MTDIDRAYYADRHAYARGKAETSEDPATRAVHLTMAERYRELAGIAPADPVPAAA